ncbi:MAG: AMP nucleosidase, partial [Rhodobacteraceae bacterium]|nr:AMP nucleosidase [Paracoccaceae bacterium]
MNAPAPPAEAGTAAVVSPAVPPPEAFADPAAAVARLEELYTLACSFLVGRFRAALTEGRPPCRLRAFYPEIRFTVTSFAK